MVRRPGPDSGAGFGRRTGLAWRPCCDLRSTAASGSWPSPGAGASVLDLLASLDQHPKTVAVEVNRELVPRARFGDINLQDGRSGGDRAFRPGRLSG